MALIKCPECGNQTSSQASSCPKCGYPVKDMMASNSQAAEIEVLTIDDDPIDLTSTIHIDQSAISHYNEMLGIKSLEEFDQINNRTIQDEIAEKRKNGFVKPVIFLLVLLSMFGGALFAFKSAGLSLSYIIEEKPEESYENGQNYSVNQIKILHSYINIRDYRSTDSMKAGKVYEGEYYDVLSTYNDGQYDWFEIRTENGVHGYVIGGYEDDAYVEYIKASDDAAWEGID